MDKAIVFFAIAAMVCVAILYSLQRFVFPVGLGYQFMNVDNRMQDVLNAIPCSKRISEETAIKLDLFDGTGKVVEHYAILGRSVNKGEPKNYDIVVKTGNYYLPAIQKSLEKQDYCTPLKTIIANKDYIIKRGTTIKALSLARGNAAIECVKKACGI